MPVVSSLILPHGTMVFDGGEAGYSPSAAQRIDTLPESIKGDCQTLFRAACAAADMAKATKPDVIFLNTPHGICMPNAHCVYLNSSAKGNAEWNGQWMEYDINITLDSKLAKAFLEHLQTDNIPAEGMLAFGICEAPLRWGEVVPLWFFKDLTNAGVKVVIFSNPIHRPSAELPLPEVTKVGRSVAKFLNSLEQRVLYIASGDLAHTHKTDCALPLYLPDPRWNIPASEIALTFDLCIERWLKCTPVDLDDIAGPAKTNERHLRVWDDTTCSVAEHWLSKGIELKGLALSCGIYGFGVLHGMLIAEVEKAASYDAHLLCRLAPTYYGMTVAAFIKRE